MATYRLNMGKHQHGGKVYERGALIVTDVDLAKLNASHGTPKFTLIPEAELRAQRAATEEKVEGSKPQGGGAAKTPAAQVRA